MIVYYHYVNNSFGVESISLLSTLGRQRLFSESDRPGLANHSHLDLARILHAILDSLGDIFR